MLLSRLIQSYAGHAAIMTSYFTKGYTFLSDIIKIRGFICADKYLAKCKEEIVQIYIIFVQRLVNAGGLKRVCMFTLLYFFNEPVDLRYFRTVQKYRKSS